MDVNELWIKDSDLVSVDDYLDTLEPVHVADRVDAYRIMIIPECKTGWAFNSGYAPYFCFEMREYRCDINVGSMVTH